MLASCVHSVSASLQYLSFVQFLAGLLMSVLQRASLRGLGRYTKSRPFTLSSHLALAQGVFPARAGAPPGAGHNCFTLFASASLRRYCFCKGHRESPLPNYSFKRTAAGRLR